MASDGVPESASLVRVPLKTMLQRLNNGTSRAHVDGLAIPKEQFKRAYAGSELGPRDEIRPSKIDN